MCKGERTIWKIRGTKAKEERRRLRSEIKGSGGAKGENKMNEGENKNVNIKKKKQRITGEIKGHKSEGGK